ncbi:histidine phosphatase family protein [Parendozoicomonas haliclonae]|nr:histidine phosphatase family protein [Parendozoicomonas haliclonae]
MRSEPRNPEFNAPPTSMNEERTITFIRHAQSMANLARRYSSNPANAGYFPAPLTIEGEMQSIRLAERLQARGFNDGNVSAVISSPLPRTRSTALIAMQQLGINPEKLHEDARITERDFGQRDGGLYSDYQEADHWFPANPEEFGGETTIQVRARMLDAWQDMHNIPGDGHILVVSHGVSIATLMESLIGEEIRIKNAQFLQLNLDGQLLDPNQR